MIRGDVNYNAASGKVERVITMDHDDPLANEITEFAATRANDTGRYQEADELRKVPARQPMGSAADGSELPGDMESES